jgi:hypothetical protein
MMSVEIDCAFPGGNILVDKVEGDRVALRQDRRDTEGWWFYWHFRVRGAAGRTLRFEFTDGKPVGVRGPAVSLDEGGTWAWAGAGSATQDSFDHSFGGGDDSVRFSVGMPYTGENWAAFLGRLGWSPALEAGELCRSRKGRAVELLRAGRLDGGARFRTALTCRHHCCEMMASYALEGLVEAVLAGDELSRWFRENVELLIVPFVDKDGVEDGDQGKNRRPRDHGRDYDDGQLYPETRAIRELLPAWAGGRPLAAIDLHCPWIRGEWNEHIYQVGHDTPWVWAEQQRFGRVLESVVKGPLPYVAAKDLAFGQAWNTGKNYSQGAGFKRWAESIPGLRLATSFEVPYANAEGAEVNAGSARAFGQDLAAALRLYLEEVGPDASGRKRDA